MGCTPPSSCIVVLWLRYFRSEDWNKTTSFGTFTKILCYTLCSQCRSVFRRAAIAYGQNWPLFLEFGWYAIVAFSKHASILRVCFVNISIVKREFIPCHGGGTTVLRPRNGVRARRNYNLVDRLRMIGLEGFAHFLDLQNVMMIIIYYARGWLILATILTISGWGELFSDRF